MNRYRIIILWDNNEKEFIYKKTKEEAEQTEYNYKMVFGNQIIFSAIEDRIFCP